MLIDESSSSEEDLDLIFLGQPTSWHLKMMTEDEQQIQIPAKLSEGGIDKYLSTFKYYMFNFFFILHLSNFSLRSSGKKIAKVVCVDVIKMINAYLSGYLYKVTGEECEEHVNIDYFLAGSTFRSWFLIKNNNKLLILNSEMEQDIKHLMKYNINFICRPYRHWKIEQCCYFRGKLCKQHHYNALTYTFVMHEDRREVNIVLIRDAMAIVGKKELYCKLHHGLICHDCRQIDARYWVCLICNTRRCKEPKCQTQFPFLQQNRYEASLKFFKAYFYFKGNHKTPQILTDMVFCNHCLKLYGQSGLELYMEDQYESVGALKMGTPTRFDLKLNLFKKD